MLKFLSCTVLLKACELRSAQVQLILPFSRDFATQSMSTSDRDLLEPQRRIHEVTPTEQMNFEVVVSDGFRKNIFLRSSAWMNKTHFLKG